MTELIYPTEIKHGPKWEVIYWGLPLYGFEPHSSRSFDHKKCDGCNFACYNHPLVQRQDEPHCYDKLCTIDVIKAGFITGKKVHNPVNAGCGANV